mmetsp:Transcript_99434/g.197026  ORF Transcript_99434/g.197026 Transcript_99434/m.197026 type:complete len:144 (+) Transcript_99434:76-507(+)
MGCSHCAKARDLKTHPVGARNFRRQEDDNAMVVAAGGRQEVGQAFSNQPRQPNLSTAGTGSQFAGDTTSDPEDAQRDQPKNAADEVGESQEREELLDKLTEHYTRKNMAVPMHWSTIQLKQHWTAIQQVQVSENTAARVPQSS